MIPNLPAAHCEEIKMPSEMSLQGLDFKGYSLNTLKSQLQTQIIRRV